MSTPAIETARQVRLARPWMVMATLCILAAGALWFIQPAARQYSVYDAASYGDLWPRRAGFIPHMVGGLVAISSCSYASRAREHCIDHSDRIDRIDLFAARRRVSLAADIAIRGSTYCRIGR